MMVPLKRPLTKAELARREVQLQDAARLMGMWVLAGRGSGKSRFVGRRIIFDDYCRFVPTVCFDPIGGTIQNILDKFLTLPVHEAYGALERVRYVDMAGTATHVVPFPLLYPAKSPYYAAQRFVELCRRTDPSLMSASILGFNALKQTATDVGMILSACGLQLSEAESFLRQPRLFADRIRNAQTQYPEIKPIADYYLSDAYKNLSARDRDMQQSAFLRKIDVLSREPTMRAIFAADTPGIDWQEVVDKRLLVLLDFSHVPDTDKQFTLLWVFASLIEYVKLKRGIGRHTPLSIVIDELTYMVGNREDRNDILAQDLNQLISVVSRNAGLWLTIMNQEMNQLSLEMQDVLFTLGTQVYGATTDKKAAYKIAERFYPYEPNLAKRFEKVWASGRGNHFVIDERQIDFSIEEQLEINLRRFLSVPKFNFWVGISPREGQMPTHLNRISIEGLDRNQYPDGAQVQLLQQWLMQRDGLPLGRIEEQIAQRAATPSIAPAVQDGEPKRRRRRNEEARDDA